MKYVCPATTVGVMREPWYVLGSLVAHPVVSSLHAISGPLVQMPLRR
jgi:hypothetical protein